MLYSADAFFTESLARVFNQIGTSSLVWRKLDLRTYSWAPITSVMRIWVFLLMLSCLLSICEASFAQSTCVNDPNDQRGLQNQLVNKSLVSSLDPLAKAFFNSKSNKSCLPQNATQKSSIAIGKVLDCSQQLTKIKKECIQASLQREIQNKGYICTKGKVETFDNLGDKAACINNLTFNFIDYSINQALACMSPAKNPIDSRYILKKINNETGFNFFLGYAGGVGMGQLTSDPVYEIAGWKEETVVRNKKNKPAQVISKYIPGNAKYILDDLMKNPNPACAPFKKIIEDDLNNPPPSPGYRNNYCTWLSAGEGLGRNLVYSLGYYIYTRDHFIIDKLNERAPLLAKNSDVVNALTLVAYGPGGPAQAKALIRSLRLKNTSNPEQVVSQITKESNYLQQTNEKMSELLSKLKPGRKPTSADLRGDTCVEK